MAPTDTPGVIAPPPLIFAGCLLAGLALDWAFGFPGIRVASPLRWVSAALCVGGGATLLAKALSALRGADTRPEPWRPTRALVTGGIYGRTRNPIYLGLALAQLGLALALDSIFGLIALLPALVAVRYGVVEREEAYLLARFGDAYRRYAGSVRRWI